MQQRPLRDKQRGRGDGDSPRITTAERRPAVQMDSLTPLLNGHERRKEKPKWQQGGQRNINKKGSEVPSEYLYFWGETSADGGA